MDTKRNWTAIKGNSEVLSNYERDLLDLTVVECCEKLIELKRTKPDFRWKAEPHIKIDGFYDETIYAEAGDPMTFYWICLVNAPYLDGVETKTFDNGVAVPLPSGGTVAQVRLCFGS